MKQKIIIKIIFLSYLINYKYFNKFKIKYNNQNRMQRYDLIYV